MKVPPIVWILSGLVVAGGGFWYINDKKPAVNVATEELATEPLNFEPQPIQEATLIVPDNQLVGKTFAGSTSANELMLEALRYGAPNYQAVGSGAGIQKLLAGEVTYAISSRPLTQEEKNSGLSEVAIGQDTISFFVSPESKAPSNLTWEQMQGIFAGSFTNWSQVGGQDAPIDLVIRGEGGTRETVYSLFGEPRSSQVRHLASDSTTLAIQSLTPNSLAFAATVQVCKQTTAKMITLNGFRAVESGYPITRQLYLVIRESDSDYMQVVEILQQLFNTKFTPTQACN